jgi:hypothetical protein
MLTEKEKALDYTRGATLFSAYAILGIITLENDTFLILITDVRSVGSIRGAEIFCITGTKFIPFDYQKEGFFSQPGVKIPYTFKSFSLNDQSQTIPISSFFCFID